MAVEIPGTIHLREAVPDFYVRTVDRLTVEAPFVHVHPLIGLFVRFEGNNSRWIIPWSNVLGFEGKDINVTGLLDAG